MGSGGGGYRKRLFYIPYSHEKSLYNMAKMMSQNEERKKTLEYCLSPVVVIIVIIFDAICQAFNSGCVKGINC